MTHSVLYDCNKVIIHRNFGWLTAYTDVTAPLWSENSCRQAPPNAVDGFSEGSRTVTFPSMSPAMINPLARASEVMGNLQVIVLKGWCMLVLSYTERLLFRIFSKWAPTSHRSTVTDRHPLVVARIPGPTQTVEPTASIVLMVTFGERGGGDFMADRLATSQTW